MSEWVSSPTRPGLNMNTKGGGPSRLEVMKAQIQQRQMQEKEQKLLQMLDSQQQRAMQKANLSGTVPPKYTNGPSGGGSWSSQSSKTSTPQQSISRTSPSPAGNVGPGAGKVRQYFEDRRKIGGNGTIGIPNGGRTLAGIDKSYPLDPLDSSKMSRSGSSKSDPPNGGRGGTKFTGNSKPPLVPLQSHSRSRPIPRTIPTPPPNIGTTRRGISLDRNQSGGRVRTPPSPSPPLKPEKSKIGVLRRSSSGFGIGNYYENRDENANDVAITSFPTSPGTIIPKTTKYKDYANDIESRESALGNKFRKLTISPIPDISFISPPNYESRSALVNENDVKTKLVKSKASTPPIPQRKTSPKEKPTSASKRSIPPPGHEECHICHRHFTNDRIAKHETICKKTGTKKRKIFDPTKMRMEGTEAEPYLRQISAKQNKKAPPPAAKKADWRKKHDEFINTIRAAKIYTQHVAAGGNPADLPPPPAADTSDYVQCPHCGRKFSAGAADRHIPKCANIKSNKR